MSGILESSCLHEPTCTEDAHMYVWTATRKHNGHFCSIPDWATRITMPASRLVLPPREQCMSTFCLKSPNTRMALSRGIPLARPNSTLQSTEPLSKIKLCKHNPANVTVTNGMTCSPPNHNILWSRLLPPKSNGFFCGPHATFPLNFVNIGWLVFA